MSRIKHLLKTYDGTTADDYDYDGGDYDDAYENPDDHAEFCDWIYDNCTCGISEAENYDTPDDGDW